MPELSICIPTYNRADLLGQLLESIARQNHPQLEVCVSDNASTDHTVQVIEAYRQKLNLVYHQWSENMGADRNYLKSVEIASGNYCWLMGSDDILAEGAVEMIMGHLKDPVQIFVFNRIECDIEMKNPKKRFWLHNYRSSVYDFSIEEGQLEKFIEYLDESDSLGSIFSYLSVIVFERSLWKNFQVPEEIVGTFYSHSYVLLGMLFSGAKSLYVPDFVVLCRGENDSFVQNHDLARRINIDIEGYVKIFRLLNVPSRGMVALLEVIEKNHASLDNVFHALSVRFSSPEESWKKLMRYRKEFGIWKSFKAMDLADGLPRNEMIHGLFWQVKRTKILLKRLRKKA